MLTDSKLKSAVDALWDKLWAGGLSNPLDAIEQLSFLFFLTRLDEREQDQERAAKQRGKKFTPVFKDQTLRWSYWTLLQADKALKHVKEKVFPFIKTLGGAGGSFAEQMENAEFKINKPNLLIEACKAINAMQISAQNQDVQGDLYEYLLSKLNTAGQNGQFRTPRHIIRMMVQMLEPKPKERICDPAAGTCGFLVNAWLRILETHTDKRDLSYDEEGYPHGFTGSKLTKEEWKFSQESALTGYDSDSGMTMLRIGSMNLMLHGIEAPNFRYTDTLSKAFNEERLYDLVLANPPFKGAIDASDVNPSLPAKVKKTEILFLHLFLRLLENGGRAAVIVPDGVLFGSSNAHVEIRKKLIEENRLDGVVSMPSGVFRPYAGVSTAVLLFTKGGTTDKIWFYDMEQDGYSLDDKRSRVPENDIPDVLECWQNRRDW
jgi:type I restriction enzyme M protein